MLMSLVRALAGRHGPVQVIETHISAVLLAGEFAYKLKKPVDLGFVDFTRRSARRHFCHEELRLNRRLAPQLYRAVVPITGRLDAPRLGGGGRAIDYAVKMRRFPASAQFDWQLRHGRLEPAQLDALVDRIARFHAELPPAASESPFGRPSDLRQAARDNLAALANGAGTRRRARLARLAAWSEAECRRRRALLTRRRAGGRVRECHGDLHLGNIVWFDGTPLPFDGIEFDPALRWQDVHGELAFLTMDLARHGRPDLAWRARDRYLQHTGDYDGVPLIDYFEVYRALVRAKVARLRAAGTQQPAPRTAALRECVTCIRLAETLSRPRQVWLAITHGLSGSGKTHYGDWLVEQLPLVRLRSDVERKRLLGLPALASSKSQVGEGAYRAEVTDRTYRFLAQQARRLLRAGWPVLVDASFLQADQRRRFATLARQLQVPFYILACQAPQEVLRARVAARRGDASEATVAVLAAQQAAYRPLTAAERAQTVCIDTTAPYQVPAPLRRR
ncbi:MAG: AAA family ATPase [Immundisolibacter sp.]